jgi:glycine dehydrogenase
MFRINVIPLPRLLADRTYNTHKESGGEQTQIHILLHPYTTLVMNNFASRHIGITPDDEQSMLRTLGLNSMDELIAQTIPADIMLKHDSKYDIALDYPLGEHEYLQQIQRLANKNKPLRTLIGMGFYGTAMPAVIQRNIFENPAWYTSYTPYQAEISQGRLEALLNFQTMICSLTGMEVSNCSLLDEASAAAEAVHTMHDLRSRTAVQAGVNVLFVDQNIFPTTLAVIRTRCEAQGIEVVVGDYASYLIDDKRDDKGDSKCFGAVVQYPAANGEVRDYAAFAERLHSKGALLTAVCDILSLAMLKEPAAWGADIAVGSTQRFGAPMGFGGPHAAYMATRKAYIRSMAGRIIGVSVDRLGNRALRMALQTREQHIKRERAGSNICTAQALMATMAGMYAVYHGAAGLRSIAQNVHRCATDFADALIDAGLTLTSHRFFDTVEIQGIDADAIKTKAETTGFNLYYPTECSVRISFDELSTTNEVAQLLTIFNATATQTKCLSRPTRPSALELPLRDSDILTQPVFSRYRSETELMRYIKILEQRDISLTHSMIPLGSCTMKLNAASEMLPLSWSGFADVHPYVPQSQAAGYYELIAALTADLAAITGFSAVSLQPTSGASGEYTGLMMIRHYHHQRGEAHRNVALIPASAHGTNPASAAMAGMQIVTIDCDGQGNISVDDLLKKVNSHKDKLSCIMITYPSTHGVFEESILRIVDIVHQSGGMVYMDGANMNAQVGCTHPAAMNADVCHLNLHKTFAMPHGGGGPGVGVVCAGEALAPFLPDTVNLANSADEVYAKAAFVVSSAPYGNAFLLPITYGYIKMMGSEGLRRATAVAILNANYIAAKLRPHYDILYTGKNGRVAHECIVDCRSFPAKYGVGAGDIARRLMDYGFHAPTVSFPVHETLMVEPTESESRSELDRFIDAMISIKNECEDIASGKLSTTDNPIVLAPHTAVEVCGDVWQHVYGRERAVFPLNYVKVNKFFPFVSKIDHGYGDRNLVVRNEG